MLTCMCYSRNLQIKPACHQQGHLGSRRISIPRGWNDHLLPLLQPPGPQYLRAYSRIIKIFSRPSQGFTWRYLREIRHVVPFDANGNE